jgi:hypothetical protein
MRSQRKTVQQAGTVTVHQLQASASSRIPAQTGRDQVVNRPAQTIAIGRAHPSDHRPHVAHLNRSRRSDEIGTRRTDDINALRARTALED